MMTLIELFCNIDDFCQEFIPAWNKELIESNEKKRNRDSRMSTSEIMTIVILFHQSGFRNFKNFYLKQVFINLKKDFPGMLSYTRFVALMPTVMIPLCAYLQTRKGKNTGISFIDSTSIKVCHNMRINRNKVFAGLATRGKGSMGWFFGFKLHLVINDIGELLGFHVTPANVGDRIPVEKITAYLTGKLFGDRGYISQKLFTKLMERGLKLVTTVRKNMKNKFMPLIDKVLLRKRFIIETVNDQLKNISQIEHSRHRSINNFMVNLMAGLAAYTLQEKKPSIKIYDKNLSQEIMAF